MLLDHFNSSWPMTESYTLHTHVHYIRSFGFIIQCCISDLKDRMTNSKLQLNEDKTGMILISPRKMLHNVPIPSEICLNGSDIKLSQTVRNLGVTLDQTLSF